MNKLSYRIYGERAYLTELSLSGGEELEVRISPAVSAALTVGRHRAKIKDGVGRVKISAIPDGTYAPLVVLADKSLKLDRLNVAHGVIRLADSDEAFATLSRDVLELRIDADGMAEKLGQLSDAVFGKRLF